MVTRTPWLQQEVILLHQQANPNKGSMLSEPIYLALPVWVPCLETYR